MVLVARAEGEPAGLVSALRRSEPQIVARCLFADFGQMQEALERRGITPLSAAHEFICTAPVELLETKANEALAMIDKLEQDEDVQNVYHSLI
jgi:transcriptional/translational regulatory protein YebC/TACO1